MAKSMTAMLLAAWLIGTLAVNVSFAREDLSPEKIWRKGVKKCVHELSHMGGDREKISRAISWLENLKMEPEQSDCRNIDFWNNIVEFQFDREARRTNLFVKKYAELFMNNCQDSFNEEFEALGFKNGFYKEVRGDIYTPTPVSRDAPIVVIIGVAEIVRKLKQAQCSDEFGDQLIEMLGKSKGKTELTHLVLECCRRYFDKCGLNDRVKRTIDTIKGVWHKTNYLPDTYPDLKDHFKSNEYWSKESNLRALRAIRGLVKFEDFSRETHCTDELAANLVNWMADQRVLGEFYGLVKDYFAFYLDECGYEDSFQERFGIEESSAEPTLFDYLYASVHAHAWQERVKSIIGELSRSASIEDNSGCSKELIENFSALLDTLKRGLQEDDRAQDLYPRLEKRLALYQGKCDEQDSNAGLIE